jgi:Tol biopolymer transport system component/DNA-binding winged helix-turn-helix (wHTH) protein
MEALVRIRFGAFELDVRAGELRKHGYKIRLQEQPFRILSMLLEHPGEVVLREEIRLNLWPDDTVVEFDHSINAAVKKLRDALGESAQKPRYIETVSKRGYRFIGEVVGPPEAPAEEPTKVPAEAPTEASKKVEDQLELSPQPVARVTLELPPALDAAERRPHAHRRAAALVATVASLGVFGVALVLWAGGAAFRVTRHEEPPPRVVPLTAFVGTQVSPSFSPDGNQVAFSWDGEKQDNPDLYVKMVGNSAVLRLTTDPAPDVAPAWSPDGRQIAFLKGGPRRGIYLISPLGGPEQKISDLVVAGGAPPAWSPDGNFLMVGKNSTDQRTEANEGALFLVPVQGGDPRLALAAPPGRSYRYPAFSPDGRSLAFVSCGGPRQWPICDPFVVALNADLLPQGQPRQLTAVGNAMVGVAWMPDGRSLLYSTRSPLRGWTLFRIDLAPGSEPRPLEIAASGAQAPAVARQGNRLAFSVQTWNTDVWQLQGKGTPQPLLVSKVADQNGQFSPDGRRIVFVSNRGSQGVGIWVANADGTSVVELTRDDATMPRWSPDGLRIVYEAEGNGGQRQISVVDSSGGRPLQITSGPFTSAAPSWSTDGKWIYFGSDRTGRFEIWRAPYQGGAAEQITRRGGFLALESVDGRRIYYTKTSLDGPLFSQSLGVGEEKQVLERVVNRGIALFEDGIYYLAETGPTKFEIRFHEFATGRSRIISPLEGPVFTGLSVSPDRKTFLFTLIASAEIDLWMIENFR